MFFGKFYIVPSILRCALKVLQGSCHTLKRKYYSILLSNSRESVKKSLFFSSSRRRRASSTACSAASRLAVHLTSVGFSKDKKQRRVMQRHRCATEGIVPRCEAQRFSAAPNLSCSFLHSEGRVSFVSLWSVGESKLLFRLTALRPRLFSVGLIIAATGKLGMLVLSMLIKGINDQYGSRRQDELADVEQ